MIERNDVFCLENVKVDDFFESDFKSAELALKRAYLNKVAQDKIVDIDKKVSKGTCVLWKNSYGYKYQQSSNIHVNCSQIAYDVDGLLNQIKREAISSIVLDANRGFNLELELLNMAPKRFKEVEELSVSELSFVEFDYFKREYQLALSNIKVLTEYAMSQDLNGKISTRYVNEICNMIL